MRELDLLEHVYRSNAALPGRVTIPPGDDAAAVQLTGTGVLVAVDQLADGVHVDLSTTPLEKVARKAITRNLSDIAAMAAKPTAAVVGASLPRGFGDDRAKRLFDAMGGVARAYDCPLVGGDILIWDHPLLLSVTVLAEPIGAGPITRIGALPGDAVCVTGHLGGSGQTLNGYTHHLDFEPRLGVARKLAADPDLEIHSMIDLSDGLAMDLPRLCVGGGGGAALRGQPLAAEIWADCLPISPAAEALSQGDRALAWHHALGDGEDYELCFTLPMARAKSTLPSRVDGVSITRIGVIKARGNGPVVSLRMPDGSVQAVEDMGWEHRGS